MCGRYTLSMPIVEVAEELSLDRPEFELEPRYNIAPTQRVPILTAEHPRRLQLMRWGLIPSWAKDPSIGNKMINARAETLAGKPAFRQGLQDRRCLVPADGFYEWQSSPLGKRPMHIHALGKGLLTFAGLWESWFDGEGREMRSFTIITTEPNTLMAPIHDRMPVIIAPAHRQAWLAHDSSPDQMQSLLRPFPDGLLEAAPASPLVGSPRNDGPELLVPPPSLF